jgi:hypothetical protein
MGTAVVCAKEPGHGKAIQDLLSHVIAPPLCLMASNEINTSGGTQKVLKTSKQQSEVVFKYVMPCRLIGKMVKQSVYRPEQALRAPGG